MAEPEPLDLRALKCPLPALMTRRQLARLPDGALLTVLTSDPLAVVDIPHLCNEDGHALLESRQADGHHIFTICKGAQTGGLAGG
jgi:tRNA 2-thiouridine synthesizing protein A